MPTLRLTRGDLRKALPSGLSPSTVGALLVRCSVVCHLPQVGGGGGTEVGVLVSHSRCGKEDVGPGLGEAGPYCLVPIVSLSVEWGQVGQPYRACGGETGAGRRLGQAQGLATSLSGSREGEASSRERTELGGWSAPYHRAEGCSQALVAGCRTAEQPGSGSPCSQPSVERPWV